MKTIRRILVLLDTKTRFSVLPLMGWVNIWVGLPDFGEDVEVIRYDGSVSVSRRHKTMGGSYEWSGAWENSSEVRAWRWRTDA